MQMHMVMTKETENSSNLNTYLADAFLSCCQLHRSIKIAVMQLDHLKTRDFQGIFTEGFPITEVLNFAIIALMAVVDLTQNIFDYFSLHKNIIYCVMPSQIEILLTSCKIL